jgi:hypothetical protein
VRLALRGCTRGHEDERVEPAYDVGPAASVRLGVLAHRRRDVSTSRQPRQGASGRVAVSRPVQRQSQRGPVTRST